MVKGRTIGRILFLLLVAAGAGVVITCFRPKVETSLYALIGDQALSIPDAIRDRSATQMQILFSAPDAESARELADRFHAGLTLTDFESIRFRSGEEDLQAYLDFYREHAGGLVSEADRETLAAGEGNRLAQRTLHRLFGSPGPTLFPLDHDPFGLLGGFVSALPLGFSGWRPEEGYLMATAEGRYYLLMVLTLSGQRATDLVHLPQIVARLEALRG